MKTKKSWIIILLVFGLLVIWFLEGRRFYCLENGKCITLWKFSNGTSYIMPYKYYGLTKPSDNYVETKSIGYIDIFWTDSLPNVVLFGVSPDSVLLRVVNKCTDKIILSNLYVSDEELGINLLQDANAGKIKKKYLNVLYNENAKKISEAKPEVSYMLVDISWCTVLGKKSSKK
jgi:hypothetical protein